MQSISTLGETRMALIGLLFVFMLWALWKATEDLDDES